MFDLCLFLASVLGRRSDVFGVKQEKACDCEIYTVLREIVNQWGGSGV